MKRNILIHLIALFIGLIFSYFSHKIPVLSQEVVSDSSIMWSFFIRHYWWLMLISFVVGYGITILGLYLINKFKK